MTGRRSDMAAAVRFMERALELLDKADESTAAAHLQQAINLANDASDRTRIEETGAMLSTDEGD